VIDAIAEHIQAVKPKTRVRAAVVVMLVCVVLWPVTSLTILKTEPQGVLAISWITVIIDCVILIMTTDIRDRQENS
jgi:uncharacterized membrane protein